MDNRDKQSPGRLRRGGGGYRGPEEPWKPPRQSEQWQPPAPEQAGGIPTRGYSFSGGPGSEPPSPPVEAGHEPPAEMIGQPPEMPRQEHRGGYPQRFYDAAYGDDFASFTSEDYGGRDFYHRRGGYGGLSSSGSYRPAYGISRWFRDDYGPEPSPSREYRAWRAYGEHRGFLARATDEVASWFGNHDAALRREHDHEVDHSGVGPADYTRPDERVREDVNDMLTHDRHVDATNITVSVSDGEVTLDGTVDSRMAKRRAETCIENIAGVGHVQNNLRVFKAQL